MISGLDSWASECIQQRVSCGTFIVTTTIAELVHKGEKALPQSWRVYVSKGLRLVPLKLAKKIWSGDYVEMEEFLPEVGRLEDSIPEPKHCCMRQVSNILTWLQCFGGVRKHRRVQSPEVITELMAYMTTIIRVNREYSCRARMEE